VLLIVLAMSILTSGCASSRTVNPQRLEHGYTVLLPGVTGRFPWDDRLAQGLADGGVPTAIEIYDWTNGPLLMPLNMRNPWLRERESRRIADKIVAYRKQYPDRPVHLVGLSGGGGMVLKALEALPPDVRVTSAVLLAPAVSASYDLRVAQSRTEEGIHNFYSPLDLLVGGAFTCAVGTIDRSHVSSAAVAQFKPPDSLDGDQRLQYRSLLCQHSYEFGMLAQGHLGGHFGWTSPSFVRAELAPILTADPLPNHGESSVVQASAISPILESGSPIARTPLPIPEPPSPRHRRSSPLERIQPRR